jgi:hypothetical protein
MKENAEFYYTVIRSKANNKDYRSKFREALAVCTDEEIAI